MNHIGLLEEAENCRHRAISYLGMPEAMFLLRVAKAFEELDAEKRGVDRAAVAPDPRLASPALLSGLRCALVSRVQ